MCTTRNELDNTITGNSNDNTLTGLAGNDTLAGDAGVCGEAANDAVFEVRLVA
jgi:Ca2+-binding RTX toxin-like protein